VVSAVLNAAALYGVQGYRMQSRQFTVVGAGGRQRPMFMGQWDDRFGTHHYAGMSDVLLTPKIMIVPEELKSSLGTSIPTIAKPLILRIATVLWCECKSGKARLGYEQEAFRENVIATGGYWLECRDCATALVAWFQEHGVERD
jgi:hypothetical protein